MASQPTGRAGRLARKLFRPVRPIVSDVVETTGTPLFPRREELQSFADHVEATMADIRRLLADHFEAAGEAEEIVGRRLGEIAGGIDELRAAVDALRLRLDELERGRDTTRAS